MKTTVMIMIAVLAMTCVAHAGDLEPCAAPAPTMKPLNDLEPRMGIHQEMVPVVINESGSYYLLGNIKVTDPDMTAITIEASDVTIDLNGFALIGPGKNSGGSSSGIYTASNTKRITIANGSLSEWSVCGCSTGFSNNCLLKDLIATDNGSYGIIFGFSCRAVGCIASNNGTTGIGVNGSQCVIEKCTASDNEWYGIGSNGPCTIKDCTAFGNDSSGIYCGGEGGVVVNCVVRYNTLGILMGNSGVVSCCTAEYNEGAGIYVGPNSVVSSSSSCKNGQGGILAFYGSSVIQCTISEDTGNGIEIRTAIELYGGSVIDCTASSNTGHGILTTQSCLISNSTAHKNGVDGINTDSNCKIINCNASENFDDGISVSGSGSRVEGNNIVKNNYGIYVPGGLHNLIIRNSASENNANNYILGSSAHGQIIDVSSGGSFISSDPWANFQF